MSAYLSWEPTLTLTVAYYTNAKFLLPFEGVWALTEMSNLFPDQVTCFRCFVSMTVPQLLSRLALESEESISS